MNPTDHNPPGLEFVDAAFAIGKPLGDRDDIMMAVAGNYATLGLLDDALAAADEMADSYLRDTAIANIANNSVASAPEADPLSLIESIDDPVAQNLALEQLAVKFAEHNLFDQALDVCRELGDRDPVLSVIVPIIAEKDSLDWAKELAHEIDDLNGRIICLIELARAAKAKEQNSQATEFLVDAEAELEGEESLESRVHNRIAIADVYHELGQDEKAKEILRVAFDLRDQIEGSSFDKDQALMQLSIGFASCADYAQADEALEQIEDRLLFGRAAIKQATERHKAGKQAEALQLLNEAGEVLISAEWSGEYLREFRDGSLMDLAAGYATIGHYHEALQTTPQILNVEHQLTTMIGLGRMAALAGLTESMFEIYEAIESDYVRATFLLTISEALRTNDKAELADRLLTKAIEQADKIERLEQKCLTLIKCASQLTESDQESRANEILSSVLKTTAGIRDGHQQARVLLAMAEEYRRHNKELGAPEKELLEEVMP
jgi:hypothetical protein